jgi:hypothetical protein
MAEIASVLHRLDRKFDTSGTLPSFWCGYRDLVRVHVIINSFYSKEISNKNEKFLTNESISAFYYQ